MFDEAFPNELKEDLQVVLAVLPKSYNSNSLSFCSPEMVIYYMVVLFDFLIEFILMKFHKVQLIDYLLDKKKFYIVFIVVVMMVI